MASSANALISMGMLTVKPEESHTELFVHFEMECDDGKTAVEKVPVKSAEVALKILQKTQEDAEAAIAKEIDRMALLIVSVCDHRKKVSKAANDRSAEITKAEESGGPDALHLRSKKYHG